MDSSHSSPRVLLAAHDVCSVELCSCNTIHLSVGPASIRLNANVAHMLLHTLTRALTHAHEQFGQLDPRVSAQAFAVASHDELH